MVYDIITNEVFLSCVISMLVCQLIKFIIGLKQDGHADYSLLFETGGMPSSHSGLVSALIISVYLVSRGSTLFFVTLFFGLIIIRDAFGLRRDAGEQAKIVNRIIADFKLEKRLKIKRLRELIGHTPTQVTAGLLIGAAIALITHLGLAYL